jgi:hypothetical protein
MSLVSDIVDNIHLDHHFRGTKRRASYISGHALPIINVVDSDNVNSATTKGYVDKRFDKVAHSLKNYYTSAVDGVITDDDITSNIAFADPNTTQSVQIEPVSTDPGTSKAIIDNVVINVGDKLLLATQKNNVNGDKTHNGVFQVTSSGAVTTLNRIEFNHGDPIPHNIHVPVTGGDVFGNTVFSHMSPATPFPSSAKGAFDTVDDFKTVGVDDLTFHKKGISDIHKLEGDNNGLAEINASQLSVNCFQKSVNATNQVTLNTPNIVINNSRLTLYDGGSNDAVYYPNLTNNLNNTSTNEIRGLSGLGTDAGNLVLSAGGNWNGAHKAQISLNGYSSRDIRFFIGNYRYSMEKMRVDDEGAKFFHSTQAGIVHKTRFLKSSVPDAGNPEPVIGGNILTIEPTKLDVGENIEMAVNKVIKMKVEDSGSRVLLESVAKQQYCLYSYEQNTNSGLLVQASASDIMRINNYKTSVAQYKPISINSTVSSYVVMGAESNPTNLGANFISVGTSLFCYNAAYPLLYIQPSVITAYVNMVPNANNAVNIGSTSNYFKDLYVTNVNIPGSGDITSSDLTGKHVFAPLVGEVIPILSGQTLSIMPSSPIWQISSSYSYSLIIQEFDSNIVNITYGTSHPQGVQNYILYITDPNNGNPKYVTYTGRGTAGVVHGTLLAKLSGDNIEIEVTQNSGSMRKFLPIIRREM